MPPAKGALTTTLLALALFLPGCAAKQLRVDLNGSRAEVASCQDRLATLENQLATADSEKALADARLAAYKEIAEKLRAAFDDGTLTLEIRNGRLVVKLPNSILYDSGSSQLKPDGQQALTKIAAVLKTVEGRNFLIAGHTDNRPVSAKATAFKTNYELSAKRALSAVYQLEASGVSPTALAAAGYGEHQPLLPNDGEPNMKLNRRTEIVIMPLLDEIPDLPKSI